MPDDFAPARSAAADDGRRGGRRRAAFFDRDGVLNEDIGFAHRPDQITWMPGAREAVKRLNDAGFLVFVVTNQGGVARGLYSEEHVRTLHCWMQEELRAVGAHVDAFYHCPHHPDHGEPPYRTDCRCRKPEPGMLLQAMAEWPVEPQGSFLIGDRETDVQAAQRAGIEGTLYRGGDLDALVAGILARLGAHSGATPGTGAQAEAVR